MAVMVRPTVMSEIERRVSMITCMGWLRDQPTPVL